jgi:hypothetical protein
VAFLLGQMGDQAVDALDAQGVVVEGVEEDGVE